MPTFALIAEGVTDQLVITQIIEELCGDIFDDDISVHPLQPQRDATDEHTAPHGGWELVLEYCRDGVREALSANEFVVVQIDTDCGEHENFGVALTEGGQDRNVESIIADTTELIRERVGSEVFDKYSHRICLAICVHSLESWLLLILHDRDERKNSLNRLIRIVQRNDGFRLKKSREDYEQISAQIRRKRLLQLQGGQESLGVFISDLIDKSSKPV